MTEETKKTGIKLSQVLAAALAAVTAAVLGSGLGVAGTVVGAALASVVTTVAAEFYLRSLERAARARALVRVRELTLGGGEPSAVGADEDAPTTGTTAADTAVPDAAVPGEAAGARGADDPGVKRVRWPVLAGASIAAFVLGLVLITGLEWVRGESLSGGDGGTTVGQVVAPKQRTTVRQPVTPAPVPTSALTVTTPPVSATEEVTTPPTSHSVITTTPGTSGVPTTSAPVTTTEPVEPSTPSQPPVSR